MTTGSRALGTSVTGRAASVDTGARAGLSCARAGFPQTMSTQRIAPRSHCPRVPAEALFVADFKSPLLFDR